MRATFQVLGSPVLRIGFDRVVIVSRAPVGALKKLLPIQILQKLSHSFSIVRYDGPDPRLRSRIVIVNPTTDFWSVLTAHANVLGPNRATHVEVACDLDIGQTKPGQELLFEILAHLSKRWHRRGHLRSPQKSNETPPAGCTDNPTFYFERQGASLNLKCYRRLEKLAGGGFGTECLRLEWTLTRGRALTRHLGGNQIRDLLAADLGAFVGHNLPLEQVDHVAIGRLFRVNGRPIRDEDQARRAAFLVLRRLAYTEVDRFPDWQCALHVCQNSPAQVRGYLRELRDKDRRPRRGRPKREQRQRPGKITDYRIKSCFVPAKTLGRV